MTEENILLQYKDEYFGRFISIKPKTFADLKPFRKTKFPHNMQPDYGIKEDYFATIILNPPSMPPATPVVNPVWNNAIITPSHQYIPGLYGDSFYDRIKSPDTDTYKNVPKRIPIIKHGEFILKHKMIKSVEQKIYELLCIFPQDIIVPGEMRMFNYFGYADWFEPFSAPEDEVQGFIKDYKTKINRKY